MADGNETVARWHPVTRDYGVIEAPLSVVVNEVIKWQEFIGHPLSKREITADFSVALEQLAPLSQGKRRRLFVATRSEWVAYFQSGIAGSDPFPTMSYLASKLGVLAMRICSTPSTSTWPGTVWEVYAPEALGGKPPLHYRRAICAMNDGGRWIFEQSGAPYPFEQQAAYASKRKRDRFSRALLEEYVSHFGIRPFADDFFLVGETAPAVLLERPRRANDPAEFSLEEVLRGEPWRRS